MAVEIVEAFTAAKSGADELNEDAYVAADRVVAVFDGETDKSREPVTPTPGRRAVEALVKASAGLTDTAEPEVVVRRLQAAVAAVSCDEAEPVAVGALVDLNSRRIIRVGDVTVGINGEFDVPEKLVDVIAGRARAALLDTYLCAGSSVSELLESDPGREMIVPLLQAARRWRNLPGSKYGFGAFDGTATPLDMIEVWDVPAGTEVVLASDGYVDPRPTLEESEKVLAELVQLDPLRIGAAPGTKGVRPGDGSFDDRTFVRIRL